MPRKSKQRKEKISENISESAAVRSENQKIHTRKRTLTILVVLLVLMVIVNLASLIFYLKPDFSDFKFTFNFNNNNNVKNVSDYLREGKCEDGTLFNECSKTQPLYCYNGELLGKAFTCGCPQGYVVEFQGCKKA